MKKKLPICLILVACFVMTWCSVSSQTIYLEWASPSGHVTTSRSPNTFCTSLTCPAISNANNTVNIGRTDYATVDFPLISLASGVTFYYGPKRISKYRLHGWRISHVCFQFGRSHCSPFLSGGTAKQFNSSGNRLLFFTAKFEPPVFCGIEFVCSQLLPITKCG
jgi:hypothetical protein